MYANYSNKIATDVSILPIKISACVNFLRTDLKINKNRKSLFFEWEIGLSKVRVKTFKANIYKFGQGNAQIVTQAVWRAFGQAIRRPARKVIRQTVSQCASQAFRHDIRKAIRHAVSLAVMQAVS